MECLPPCTTTPDAHCCPFFCVITLWPPGISVHWSSAAHIFILNRRSDRNDWAFKAHGEPPSLHSDLITSYKTQTCHLSLTFHVSLFICREHCKGISHCSAPTLLDVQLHPQHPVFSVIYGMQSAITHGRVKETAYRFLDLAKHSD